MPRVLRLLLHAWHIVAMLPTLVLDAACFLRLCLRTPVTLADENLFLHKQLAMYQEHDVKPQRATHATRFALVWLGRWFDWRQVLHAAQPVALQTHRHQWPVHQHVVTSPILSGLHHEYRLGKQAA